LDDGFSRQGQIAKISAASGIWESQHVGGFINATKLLIKLFDPGIAAKGNRDLGMIKIMVAKR
jgi:hypothetical protein